MIKFFINLIILWAVKLNSLTASYFTYNIPKPLNIKIIVRVYLGGVLEMQESLTYKNLISHIDIDRSINSIQYINFRDINNELEFNDFMKDIGTNNDTIELNLIKNKAYKEAVIMSLNKDISRNMILIDRIREDQKTFGGSKLFYISDSFDKLLVISVPRSMEGKLNMVINRLNKINDKIARLNSKIKKENLEIYIKRQSLRDKKDIVANMINEKLKV